MSHKRGPKLCCMLPRGAVLSPGQRVAGFAQNAASGARYSQTEHLSVPFPLLPVMPFGLTYELDLVFMTKHPSWNMHEYALIRTSAGLIWLLKDAREGTMEQTIIAGVDDIDDWMPEVPVQRRHQAFDVIEAISSDTVEVSIDYENWDGDSTQVWFKGAFPRTLQRKRNSSTMRHSLDQMMAVLDLSHQNLSSKGHVTIAGERQKLARIFGVGVRTALQQTQGGLVVGDWLQTGSPTGFTTGFSARSGRVVPRAWTLQRQAATSAPSAVGLSLPSVYATQDDADRQLVFRFLETGDGALELRHLWAWQKGQSAAGFSLELSPALPDLRRRFDGEVTCRWVADVAGQLSHATGTLTARWTDDGPEVELRPQDPWWVWDRPMRSTLRPEGDGVRVRVQRIPTVGEPPSNRRCIWPAQAASGG